MYQFWMMFQYFYRWALSSIIIPDEKLITNKGLCEIVICY